jgi:ATP-dependent phosphofructokinase / diphosphate-dependent phosphofructokinase
MQHVAMPRRAAVLQSGGPTVTLNASLRGFVEEARKAFDLWGVRGGPVGLRDGAFFELRQDVRGLESRAGAWLRAGRCQMGEGELERAVHHLAGLDIHHLALAGGNGTMTLAWRLSHLAAALGFELHVAGIPKTIDNDLWGTDHSPGYASAARFLSLAVPDLAQDHQALLSIERVRIVESLGRDAGWLALSAAIHKTEPGDAPHLVFLPEHPFVEDQFLAQVERCCATHGSAFVVVAEGFAGDLMDHAYQSATFDRPLAGGVSRRLADLVQRSLGVTVRAEVLGTIQRCCTLAASGVDRREAMEAGGEAARLLAGDNGGQMVAIQRGEGPVYRATMTAVPLSRVEGRTRRLPDDLMASPHEPPHAFQQWLGPLLAEPK